jgi:hypothetical protein
MGLYHNRIQAPTKTLTADWIPEEGELFRDSAGYLYCGDNVTASNALTPVSNGAQGVKRYVAKIVQSGTNAPALTIQDNSLTGVPAPAYAGVGDYTVTLTGAFNADTTIVDITPNVVPPISDGSWYETYAYVQDADTIIIRTGIDGVLANSVLGGFVPTFITILTR